MPSSRKVRCRRGVAADGSCKKKVGRKRKSPCKRKTRRSPGPHAGSCRSKPGRVRKSRCRYGVKKSGACRSKAGRKRHH